MNKTKRIVSIAGTLLTAVALVFIARRLMEHDVDFSVLASPWVIAGIVLVALVNGLLMCAAAINYRAWIRNVTGITVTSSHAMKFYCASNLYKYIPGGVLFVLGRHRLAVEYGALRHSPVLFATGLEGLFTVLAVIIVILMSTSDHLSETLAQVETPTTVLAVLAVLLVLAVSIAYLYRKRIAEWFRKAAAGRQSLKARELVKRMGFALMIVFLWGAIFMFVTVLLGQPLTPNLAFTIIGLYLIAWLAGAAVPGVPGGLGVREAALLFIMSGTVCESVLLSAIIVHRILVVIGDVLAYCTAVMYRLVFSKLS
jgi:uncharacterized membrane protein YbhN (UPF0104 family)